MKRLAKLRSGLLLPVALILPWVLGQPYLQHLAVVVVISGIVAVGLGLLVGDTDTISLGHAGFVGIGAYTSALLAMRLNWPFLPALLAAALLSGLIGYLFALPVLRLKGHFIGMATLGFGQLLQAVFLNWESVTNGPNGLPGVPPIALFGWQLTEDWHYYYLALAILVLIFVGLQRVRRSPFGRTLKMIREDEVAAKSLGVRVGRYKTLAFALSAAIAAVGGTLLGHFMFYVSPEPFGPMASFTFLAMVVLGGMRHPFGPLLGALVLELLPEVLRGLSDYRMLIYGVLLVLMLPLRPEGILSGRHGGWRLGRLWPRKEGGERG
jgi:branched-chain amino acid transport system permease protein